MKYSIYISCLLIFFISCSSIKNDKKSLPVVNLNEKEKEIINDFLNAELAKDNYKSYKGFEIVIIEEAMPIKKSLDTYLYSYEEWKSMEKIHKQGDIHNMYFLDSLQISKIKNGTINEPPYYWKISDFNTRVELIKKEDLIKIINTNAYINLTKKLIIYLSRPLVIDTENVLLSFDIGNGQLGFSHITHFAVLLKKTNYKWIEKALYYDGVYY